MAVVRNHPYGRFNFTVEIEGMSASFSEVTLPTAQIDVTDYREGADRDNSARKVPGLTKYSNLVLKCPLSEWWRHFSGVP